MPAKLLASLAKKAGADMDKAESAWQRAKELAADRFKPTDASYWPYVVGITKKALGLAESLTFSDYLLLTEDKKEDGVKSSYLDFKGSSRKRELKKEMKREIGRFSKMKHTDKDAYPDDWTADRKYRQELKRKGKKLPTSQHTDRFKRMYGEALVEDAKLDTALKNKAEKTGVSVRILRAVYNRGLAAWRTGHRPGVGQHQWAMGRVNSFLTGGPARKADEDLWKKARDKS